MEKAKFPILEFDPTPEAILEPGKLVKPIDAPERCVVTFFGEVLERLEGQDQLKVISHNKWEDGDHKLYELEYQGQRLAAFHPGVGAPIAANLLEEFIAMGCRKFIACGGCGVLDREIAVGHLVVPTHAVRDEGTSYHYLPPGREVEAHPKALAAIERTLQEKEVAYRLGKTWTTDAPYRETHKKVALRRNEGCLTVEMEAAAFFAVAAFRNVVFGQILYGGDDVSGLDEWDRRGWHDRHDIREQLFWLAVEAALKIED
jgi:uridine phosphorylase